MNVPQQQKYIVGTFVPANRGWWWLCKRPSDKGSFVFAPQRQVNTGRLSFWPMEQHEFVVHISSEAGNGNSRRGDTVACVADMNSVLIDGLAKATWELDQHGRPIARGLSVGGCAFEAHFDNGHRSSGQDVDPFIFFEPTKGSLYEDLASELRIRLGTWSQAEIERAKAAKFPPDIKRAPCLGELLAEKQGH